jgi:membrane-associated phospholipid phosphatase
VRPKPGDTWDMDPDANAPTHRFQWGVVLVAALVFSLLALEVWHSNGPTRWEHPIISAVNQFPLPLRGFWTAMFEPIPFALITLALGFAAAAHGRTSLAVAGVTGSLAAVVTAELVFKPLVDRVRLHVVGIHPHLAHLGGPMFPSAHVTAAAAWATFAWMILDQRSRLRPLLVALPLILGWAVVSKNMHFPADVAGGLLLGPTVVYCTVSALRAAARWEARSKTEPARHDRVNVTV